MRFIGNAPVDGEVRAIASGALATGDAVVVNSDGTVSVVEGVAGGFGSETVYETADSRNSSVVFDSSSNKVVIAYTDSGNSGYGTYVVGTVSGTSISFGTPGIFNSGFADNISLAFDSTNNKVVFLFRNGANSNYGTASVGTVSGTSISFGTAVIFNAGDTREIAAVYDVNAQKIVISYKDASNSNYGTAIVGTVSGTSISFGSEVVFRTDNIEEVKSVYDASAQKVVTVYKDVNPGFTRYGTAIVGTVSGTSISFGSSVVFSSSVTEHIAATYDSDSQKVVIAYRDGGSSDHGRALVGTVSGTSISFGAVAVLSNSNISELSAAYNSSAQKVVIAYEDGGNSGYGTAVEGTVSGTSIVFESVGVFSPGNTGNTAAGYDSTAEKVVISYRDSGNSAYGTAVVYGSASTYLTSENFVGFVNSGYADGQSAALNSTCSVDNNQSGLTAGETYYVQTDGTLGATPADPSVVAGTAISSNSIIVKG